LGQQKSTPRVDPRFARNVRYEKKIKNKKLLNARVIILKLINMEKEDKE